MLFKKIRTLMNFKYTYSLYLVCLIALFNGIIDLNVTLLFDIENILYLREMYNST